MRLAAPVQSRPPPHESTAASQRIETGSAVYESVSFFFFYNKELKSQIRIN